MLTHLIYLFLIDIQLIYNVGLVFLTPFKKIRVKTAEAAEVALAGLCVALRPPCGEAPAGLAWFVT